MNSLNQKKTDILLIQPPIRDFYLTQKRTIPYGLASIAAGLKASGFSVILFDALATKKKKVMARPREMNYLEPFYPQDLSAFSLFQAYHHFGYSYEHLENVVRHAEPKLVGISSLFTAYSEEALSAAEIVRKSRPEARIVLGGHHPTALPEQVIDHPAVDFVIRGEGEAALPRLARSLFKGDLRTIEAIPGIVFRTADNKLINNEPALMESIDAYPPASLDDIQKKYYKRHKKGQATIVTSRGCPFHCSYCCVGVTAGRYRQRSVSSVLDEIVTAVEDHDVGFIDFEDEHLTLHKKWFLELLSGIQTHLRGKSVELRAMNGLFPPSLDFEILEAMEKAGFKALNLSIGSTSARMLKQFQRQDVKADVERILGRLQTLKLKSVCYLIAGAPGQVALDSLKDLFFLADKPTLIGLSIYYPAPGSQDYLTCQRLGLLPDRFALMRSSALPLDYTTSRLEAATLLRLTRILNYLKGCIDTGMPLPAAKPFDKKKFKALVSDSEKNAHLLESFFYDFKIRGIAHDGEAFEHLISSKLCQAFAEGLNLDRVKGTMNHLPCVHED